MRHPCLTAIVAMKATSDPAVDGNWADVDFSLTGELVVSMWCFEDSGDIHIATQGAGGIVRYHVFDPGTDTFTTKNEVVVTNAPLAGVEACSIAVRSDGDVIIGYAGQDGGDGAIFYAREEGAGWTTNVQVDGAASTNDYSGIVIVLGLSDRMHFFYFNDTLDDFLHRSLSSTNVLDTADQVIDATGAFGLKLPHNHGVSYVSGATKVRVPYGDFNARISIAKFDSGADPTITTDAGVTAAGTSAINGNTIICLSVDGATLHLLWSDSATLDIFHDENDDDGGWGTDTEEKDAVTCNRISCNVYTRGSLVLAYLYLDIATVKYAERSLAAATAIRDMIGGSGIIPYLR